MHPARLFSQLVLQGMQGGDRQRCSQPACPNWLFASLQKCKPTARHPLPHRAVQCWHQACNSTAHNIALPLPTAHLLQLLCTRTAQVQPRGLLLQRLGQIEAQGGLHCYFHRAPCLFRSQLLR